MVKCIERTVEIWAMCSCWWNCGATGSACCQEISIIPPERSMAASLSLVAYQFRADELATLEEYYGWCLYTFVVCQHLPVRTTQVAVVYKAFDCPACSIGPVVLVVSSDSPALRDLGHITRQFSRSCGPMHIDSKQPDNECTYSYLVRRPVV